MISAIAVAPVRSQLYLRRKTPSRQTPGTETIQRYLRNHSLERITVNPQEVSRLIELAHTQRRGASFNEREFPVLAYNAAYFSILNSCDALLAAHGYRARGHGGHEVALNCASELIAPMSRNASTLLRIKIGRSARKMRSKAMYDGSGVSAQALADIIERSDFLIRVLATASGTHMRRVRFGY
jgi:uncharacterized protein (UPF0332 family)